MAGDNAGLRCPSCNSAWSEVVNTIRYANMVRRYRRCMHCQKRFPTTELSHRPKPDKKKSVKDDPFDFDEVEDIILDDD